MSPSEEHRPGHAGCNCDDSGSAGRLRGACGLPGADDVHALVLADQDGEVDALVRGYDLGSISMTCYGVGLREGPADEASGSARLPPDIPPDQTNT